MTITEAIAQLEAIRAERGDLQVGWDNDGLACVAEAEFRVCDPKDLNPYDDEDEKAIGGKPVVFIFSKL